MLRWSSFVALTLCADCTPDVTRHACVGHMLHSTDWLSLKSYESQKIHSSQRFIDHGCGAGVDGLNASKLQSVLAGGAGATT